MTEAPLRRLRLSALAALLALTAAACAGTSMATEMGPRYSLAVINEMPHAMIVRVDDGSGARLLGTVGAEREERFVLDAAETTTVTLIATDREETHTVRRTVVLAAGETVEVRLN